MDANFKSTTGMFDLGGQTALVTGASGGIGAAIAGALHRCGAAIMLAGRRQDALEALAHRLEEGVPGRVHIAVAALEDPAAPDRLVRAAEAAMGRIDILVNNAGHTRDALMLRMTDAQWQSVIDLDLGAAFRLTRAALRGMVRRRHGRVIQISSAAAVAGNPGQANYAAAKAALIGMSKSLAAEVASRGITVNCIAPGFIETPMTAMLGVDQRARLIDAIPTGRSGTPEEVAAAVVYLASSEAAYVTGHTLHVNGGMVMI